MRFIAVEQTSEGVATIDLYLSKGAYDNLNASFSLATGLPSVGAFAQAHPYAFAQYLLDEAAKGGDRVVSLGGSHTSSFELGVTLLDALAIRPDVDLSRATVALACWTTPPSFVWRSPETHDDLMRLMHDIQHLGELTFSHVIEPMIVES